ncbi:MAG: hypothetical protein K9M45_08655 [Kiritimatiellales bacterium]|nr:hypothetical protein [Kiritimatiellales bacterium]
MIGNTDSIIEAIQSSGYKAALAITGGGSGALHALLAHPGASRFVLEVQIPYCPEALIAYLDKEPEQSCSADAAVKMAAKAFERASKYQASSIKLLSISCTAALQTNRERKGSDRAFVCAKAKENERVYALEFSGGTRAGQEDALSATLLNLIAENTGVSQRLEVPEEICRIR